MQKIVSNFFKTKDLNAFKEWIESFENATIFESDDEKIKIIINECCLEELERDSIEFLQSNVAKGCLVYFTEIFCDEIEVDARCLIIRDEEFTFLNFKDFIYEHLQKFFWRKFDKN